MKLDMFFFVSEVAARGNHLLAQVTDSFLEKDDSGVVTVQIKLKQKDDKGNIEAQVEINSKNAKYTSLPYECHKTKDFLESGQLAFSEQELNEGAA